MESSQIQRCLKNTTLAELAQHEIFRVFEQIAESEDTGFERKSRRAPTRLKEHKYHAPSIAIRPAAGLTHGAVLAQILHK